jgi:hypothetical protein
MNRHCLVRTLLACATLAGLITAATPADADPILVTTCGQGVKGTGFLSADLDCSATTGPAIILTAGSRLFLGGFTLTGNEVGVRCEVGACKIYGPGTIRRKALNPDFENHGVLGLSKARVEGVTLENWRNGVFVLGPAEVRKSTLLTNTWGVSAGPVRVTDSTFSGNQYGAYAYEGTRDGVHYKFYAARIRRATFTGNTIDIAAFKLPTVRDTTCTTSDHLTVPSAPWSGGDEWNVCP